MNPLDRRGRLLHEAERAVAVVMPIIMMVRRKRNPEKETNEKRTKNFQGKIFINSTHNGIRSIGRHKIINYVMGNKILKAISNYIFYCGF
jgi:hypothetical protein